MNLPCLLFSVLDWLIRLADSQVPQAAKRDFKSDQSHLVQPMPGPEVIG